jgi:LPXTG-site transpeptidase (sortase) family protein
MKRIVNTLGSALVLVGIALLAYVGIQYHNRSVATVSATQHWSASQNKKGGSILKQLTSNQTVKVPASSNKHVSSPGKLPAIRMIIPSINVNSPVVDTPPVNGIWDVADWKVGHLSTTPNPGAPGNAAYSAHDDIKGEIFKRVDELKPGSKILLRTRTAQYTYVVTGQQVVDPSNTSPLDATTRPTITLISCTPYWVDTQRLIIKAVLKSSAAR